MTTETNRLYARHGGVPLHVDFIRPNVPDPLPLVVCIHGGGWISGCKEDMHEVAYLLAEHGVAVACPQYRLAPLHTFPAAVEDVQSLVRFSRRHANEWGIDPDRIAALGNSAGGHLASMLGVSNPPAPEGEDRAARSQVNAVVAICPITDMTHPQKTNYEISLSFLEQFMGGPFDGNEDRYRQASPVHHVSPNASPFLIFHGDADEIVPVAQSDTLADKLTHNGVEVQYHRLPGEGHGFSPSGFGLIMNESLKFLQEKIAIVR